MLGYIDKFNRLKVHFDNPSKWIEHDPRGNTSIYEALKVQKESSVKIYWYLILKIN